jgi:hypothetical protein
LEEIMDWHIRLAALLIMLTLFGCAQGQGQYAAPYSPDNNGSMPERGSGDSGGGGGGSM